LLVVIYIYTNDARIHESYALRTSKFALCSQP